MKRPLHWRVIATVILILVLTLLFLVIVMPEIFICNSVVFRVLRYIPDGCLRWKAQ